MEGVGWTVSVPSLKQGGIKAGLGIWPTEISLAVCSHVGELECPTLGDAVAMVDYRAIDQGSDEKKAVKL